ncbi:MAG: hypothetical protein JW869_08745 [Candidatus Omnitrophica bacterium]|nr:hypothetical protein [Candidatus Omnitrophota bacterium]
MKKATLYIIILCVACTGLGVVVGVAADRRYIARNLPQIMRKQMLERMQDPNFQRGMGGFGTRQFGPGQFGPGEGFEGADRMQRMQQFAQKRRQMMQGRQGGEDKSDRLFGLITQELNLTDEQSQQVKTILDQNKEQLSQKQKEFRAYLQELKENNHAQIAEVLDEEQKAKFQEWAAKAEERRKAWQEQCPVHAE